MRQMREAREWSKEPSTPPAAAPASPTCLRLDVERSVILPQHTLERFKQTLSSRFVIGGQDYTFSIHENRSRNSLDFEFSDSYEFPDDANTAFSPREAETLNELAEDFAESLVTAVLEGF